jgi:ribosomal protein S18 acetylase RimI-like enzyme
LPTPQRLAPFPSERADRTQTPALLIERGFSLRTAHDSDLPWLRDLYASTRAEEMAPVPWPALVKRTFLDEQFGLQHNHYVSHFGDTDFLAIEHNERGAVGRYYIQRTAPAHLLVDISLFPAHRGSGVGSAIIRQSQHDAAASGHGMRLHVHATNADARRLYERLGFVAESLEGAHQAMRWTPTPPP